MDALRASSDLRRAGVLSDQLHKAHARRHFFEAVKALQKSEQKESTPAHEIVHRIDALYTIEREIKQLSDDERRQARQLRAVPLLESLHLFAQSLKPRNIDLRKARRGSCLSHQTVAEANSLC